MIGNQAGMTETDTRLNGNIRALKAVAIQYTGWIMFCEVQTGHVTEVDSTRDLRRHARRVPARSLIIIFLQDHTRQPSQISQESQTRDSFPYRINFIKNYKNNVTINWSILNEDYHMKLLWISPHLYRKFDYSAVNLNSS